VEPISAVISKRKNAKCTFHGNGEIYAVCSDCDDVPICTQCTLSIHNGHQYQTLLKTGMDHRSNIQNYRQKADDRITSLIFERDSANLNFAQFQNQCESIFELIQSNKLSLISQLEAYFDSLQKTVQLNLMQQRESLNSLNLDEKIENTKKYFHRCKNIDMNLSPSSISDEKCLNILKVSKEMKEQMFNVQNNNLM
jgi:hypothetical protein